MADAIELVRRCPEVSFILDHIGKPGIRDGHHPAVAEPDARTRRTAQRDLQDLRRRHRGRSQDLDLRPGGALRRPCDRVLRFRPGRLRRRLAGGRTGDPLRRLGGDRRPGHRRRERGGPAQALPRQRHPLLPAAERLRRTRRCRARRRRRRRPRRSRRRRRTRPGGGSQACARRRRRRPRRRIRRR